MAVRPGADVAVVDPLVVVFCVVASPAERGAAILSV